MKKKMVQKGLVVILILSLGFMISACKTGLTNEKDNPQQGAECEDYYVFRDDIGELITLHSKPQKVAVLFSSYADVWICAGGEVAVTVGETIERGFVDENVILVDKGAGKTIDMECLIASQPDFVICSADIPAQVDVAKILNENGIPAACFRVDAFSDYQNMLKICTDITENQEAYQKNAQEVLKKIETIFESVPDEEEKNILFIRAGASTSSTKAKTAKDNFVCMMLKELGTNNIAEEAPVLLDGLSIEEILIKNPEHIFISTMGEETAAIQNMMTVFSQPEWQELEAVKEGRYTFLPKEMFQYKPNARWAEAYQYLMDVLYGKE